MNWANKITIIRILLVPVFIGLILYHRLNYAFAIFVLASITDGLDGFVARKFNQKTDFGTMLDPIADKMLITSAFISLSIVSGLPEYMKMPIYVPVVIISREVLMLLGLIIIFVTNGTIKIKPTIIGKATTVFQMLTVISVLLHFVYSSWVWNAAVFFTILSGFDYLRIGAKQINGR